MTETRATVAQEHDVVVIGGGPAGENVADRAVRGGLTAVLVESELVGGECSYWACMPSKALLRSAEAVAAARRLRGAREAVTGRLDVDEVLDRRDSFTSFHDDAGQARWLADAGIGLVRGQGRLAGSRRVVVTAADGAETVLTARHAVVVATGTRAALPPVPGLADARPWTSREATTAKDVPPRLVVLGGGVVAVEMATAWKGLGAEEVTILEQAPRLLVRTEPEVGRRLAEALAEQGIDVRTGVEIVRVERAGIDGPVTVTLADGTEVVGDELLVAAGRRPATDDLGLETVGLAPGRYLATDDTLRVEGVDGGWLYAVGDVNGRALLTHMGKYQARAAGDVIAARAAGDPAADAPADWARFAATADRRAVPQVVFTDPQVAAVGRTEAEAREAGLRVRAVEYEIGRVAGAALYEDGYRGWAKMVVDEDRGVVVGVTMIGSAVGELIHAGTVAVAGEVPLDRLWHAVPPYPAISEIWLRLLEAYGR